MRPARRSILLAGFCALLAAGVAGAQTPTVQFVMPTFTVNENMMMAMIDVTLSTPSAQTVTVNYATANGTASSPADFTATSGQLSFSPGSTMQSFWIMIVNDTVHEPDETVHLTLSAPVNATLGVQSTAVLTIVDDDPPPPPPPTVSFAMSHFSVHENMLIATVTVNLAGMSMNTVTVQYATSDGTATAGADYQPASGTLTFPPAIMTQSFDVVILDDFLVESPETIQLTLSNPTNATLGGQSTATLTINDDDVPPPTVSFSMPTFSASENSNGASIMVSLSAPYGQQITVHYATSNGTATTPADYTATSGTLTFPPNSTSHAFLVPIVNDLLNEDDEAVNLTLSNPTNATLGGQSTAVLTITDDDPPPMVQFADAGPVTVSESIGTATFNVMLTTASARTITVEFATADGMASAPADYSATSGTLTFHPGETTKTIPVPIVEDSLYEMEEHFTIALSNATNALLGGMTPLEVRISDNDPQPTVQLSAANPLSVSESIGTATFTVTLNTPSGLPVSVPYHTAMGTAQDPADFTNANGTLTFNPGETSKIFSVTINDDALDEEDETFTVNLGMPTGAVPGGTIMQTVTIVDDDEAPRVHFTASYYSVREDAGSAIITVGLSDPSAKTIAVQYGTSDGTAVAPADYLPSSGALTFAPGETSQTFMIPIVNDATPETTESVHLMLSTPTNATLAAEPNAILTVTDDDEPVGFTVHLKEVTFGGAERTTVYADEGDQGPYEAPHWLDVNLNGNPLDPGDRDFPVCYTRASWVQVGARFTVLSVAPPGRPHQTPRELSRGS